MDGTRFDGITKSLVTTGSRRLVLRTLLGSAVATGLGWLGMDGAVAKKKRKKKLRKNEYGCVNVGNACRGKDAKCCSGICQGKKPKKGKKDKSRCVAHNVLACPAGADACGQPSTLCGAQPGPGVCWQTTGQASFCGLGFTCTACTKDADCKAGFGPGAACIVCGSCPETGGLACIPAAD